MDVQKVQIVIETELDDAGLKALTSATSNAAKQSDKLASTQKNVDKQVKATDKSSNSLASTFKSMLGPLTALIAAYTSFIFLVTDATKLAKEQMRVEKELEFSLLKRAKALGQSSAAAAKDAKSIKDLASALQEKLAIGDEELLQSATMLTRVGATSAQMERLLTLTSDYSKATGKASIETTKTLAATFNDLPRAMGQAIEAGISFTEAERQTISTLQKTNRVAEGQELILKKLEDQFGGTAAAVSQDFDGSLARATNTIGDFQEEIGYTWRALGSPVLKDVKNLFSSLISIFQSQAAKDMTVTVSGIVGAVKSLAGSGISAIFGNMEVSISTVTDSLKRMGSNLENVNGIGSMATGILIQGFAAIGSTIDAIIKSTLALGEALAKVANPAEWGSLNSSISNLKDTVVKEWSEVGSSISNIFDAKKMRTQGEKILADMTASIKKYQDDTRRELSKQKIIPDSVINQAGNTGTAAGKAFTQAQIDAIKENAGAVENAAMGTFSFLDSLTSMISISSNKAVDLFAEKINQLETSYSSALQVLDEQEQALADRRLEREVLDQEQKQLNLEAELARMSEKSEAFLTAQEKEKQKQLKTQKELLAKEREEAKERERINKERQKLEKELADQRAALAFQQETAQWTNEKNRFDADKKQQLYSSSVAMAKAPVDAALAITKAFSIDPTGILAAAAAGASLSAVATVIGSATQLASTASQSFDVPKPVKAAYTGASIPLYDGAQFKIGGRYGAEEMATVTGGVLKVDNAVTTANKTSSDKPTMVFNGDIIVRAESPQDFVDQLKQLMRRERYE